MRIFFWVFKILFIFILPFVVLIRGAVYVHTQFQVYPHIALIAGMGFTFVVLFIYSTFFLGRHRRDNKRRSLKGRALIVGVLLLSYCIYGLFYVSGKNVKSEAVGKEYRSLHPILRMGISTIIFLDPSLILTDANRLPEDYRKMGLKTKSHSLHYRQSNGFAHAVDIRTNGRSMLRNSLLQLYFKMMGFNVLRHGGTGDHLHISMMSHDRPYAK